MPRWTVEISARRVGAIGIMALYRYEFTAEDAALAAEAARNQAYEQGLEHVNIEAVFLAEDSP